MTHWSKRDRLEAVLAGEIPDRVPVALWRHFPGDDQRAEDQARSHIEFQQTFDFDFVKVTPSSSYCLEDWGVLDRYEGNLEGTRRYLQRVIKEAGDWNGLPLLDPSQGALGRQLACLRTLGEKMPDVPFIQTVFNPLSQARNLAGGERMLAHMRAHPDALLIGLKAIAETTVRFVEEVSRTGAAGIFLAVQHASYRLMSEEEYRRFGEPFDRQILEALDDTSWLNVLHVHGEDIMFDLFVDYPTQVINWHDRETAPSLVDALGRTRQGLVGGLQQWETMVRGDPSDVEVEVGDAMRQTGGRRLIIGTGCVTPIVAPFSNLHAARAAVEKPMG